MELQWLGVNAFRFVAGETIVLLDPYVTRRREPLCDPAVAKQYFPEAAAIIISHSHWDHLADGHVVAAHTGAEVFGSRTTVSVCQSFGLPDDRLVVLAAGDRAQRPAFSVQFFASRHVVLSNGTVAYAGTYETPPPVPPRTAPEYLEGGTFAVLLEIGGYRILDIGSANLEDGCLRGLEVDVLLLGAGGWQRTPRYLERVFENVSAKLVVPCHHDDFLVPLEKGIVIRDQAALDELIRRIPVLSPGTEVCQLDLLETLRLP
jgi:L-ascorbate metabolism protein UlaG (beta-lactamase superfamily)